MHCITCHVHVTPLTLCSDEAYEGQIFTAAHAGQAAALHTRVAALPHMRPRTLTLGTSSKLFSLTGWRVGWCCPPAPETYSTCLFSF